MHENKTPHEQKTKLGDIPHRNSVEWTKIQNHFFFNQTKNIPKITAIPTNNKPWLLFFPTPITFPVIPEKEKNERSKLPTANTPVRFSRFFFPSRSSIKFAM